MLNEHDSSQLYDIVHFEPRLSYFCFELSQKALFQWKEFVDYKPTIIF